MKRWQQKSPCPMYRVNKKYIPNEEEAQIITNYFLHNNFQDFNTWQQISKSKCDFDYNQSKPEFIECKVVLKWDDASMPVLAQVGISRSKKYAKKKALKKLIENLIFLGLIGYGFKEADFIKKMPKRRQQSSGDESQPDHPLGDKKMQQMLSTNNPNQAFSIVSNKNFQKLLSYSIRENNLQLFIQILRKLQNIKKESYDISFCQQDLEEEQNFDGSYLAKDGLQGSFGSDDLVDQLKCWQISIDEVQEKIEEVEEKQMRKMELPTLRMDSSTQGKISFQFFHPIEFTLIFRRNLLQSRSLKPKNLSSSFFSLQKEIEQPKFEEIDDPIPLPYKVIQRILNIILEFSYNYRLVINLLSIFERQVTVCSMQANSDNQSQQFYLRQVIMLTAQFAYLLNKKLKILSICIQGLINVEADGLLIFQPKEPEDIIARKISKKVNTNQMEEMQEFANQEFVLMVSKIDPQVIFIGQIIESWPTIKIKSLSFDSKEEKQKLPFTVYKLSNSKLYNRLCRSIAHISKQRLQKIRYNSFIIIQKPTQPLLSIIVQLTAEALSLNQTVLIVSDNFHQIYVHLLQKGFKVVKINPKLQERSVVRKQVFCAAPASVCADAIRNYAFTRVLIEGAQRISESMTTLALDKGYKKVYLIGDDKLPESLALTKFAKSRKITKSMLKQLLRPSHGTHVPRPHPYNFPYPPQPHQFQFSILQYLNRTVYRNNLNMTNTTVTPLIKGFPWPSEMDKLAFVQMSAGKGNQRGQFINRQVSLCCQIVYHVVKSGFVGVGDIGCRVGDGVVRGLLTARIYAMFQACDLGATPDLAIKSIDFATGFRFRQKSLCILIVDSSDAGLQYLNAGLQEARRGIIVLADFDKLKDNNQWIPVLRAAQERKVFLRYQKMSE